MAMVREVTEGEILPGGGDESDQAVKFEEFRASAADEGGQVITTVYLSPTNSDGTAQTRGMLQQMFSCPIDQYDRNQIIDKVRHEFMGATDALWYIRIQVRKTGTKGLLLNQLVAVRKQIAATDQLSSAPGAPDSSIAKILAQMQANTQQMLQTIADRLATPQTNVLEVFLAGQKSSTETLEKLMTAMGGRAPGVANDAGLEGTLKQLMIMRQINELTGSAGAAAAAAASGSDIAEIIKAATPLIGPGLSFLSTWLQTKKAELEKNKPPAQKQLPAPAQSGAAASPPASTSNATAATSAPTPAVPKPTDTPKEAPGAPKADTMKEEAMLYAMREQLGQLADAIALNPDPAAVGEQILTNLPEAYDEPLFTLLSSETWFDRMVAVQNKLAPYREWMEKLRTYLIESFTEETAESTPT